MHETKPKVDVLAATHAAQAREKAQGLENEAIAQEDRDARYAVAPQIQDQLGAVAQDGENAFSHWIKDQGGANQPEEVRMEARARIDAAVKAKQEQITQQAMHTLRGKTPPPSAGVATTAAPTEATHRYNVPQFKQFRDQPGTLPPGIEPGQIEGGLPLREMPRPDVDPAAEERKYFQDAPLHDEIAPPPYDPSRVYTPPAQQGPGPFYTPHTGGAPEPLLVQYQEAQDPKIAYMKMKKA